ncbi:MAG: FtsX-like permease family protein [Acidimicrobiales bacterium]
MFRLSLRSLLAKKLRLLTTAIAIVLGVAFTAGTMILADTMSASFSSTIDDLGEGVDAVVRGDRLDPDDSFSPRATVPFDTLETVRSIDGVRTAAPYWEGYAQVIGADGKALDLRQSVGLNWIADPDLTMFHLVDGTAPRSGGEVVLDSDTADHAELDVGDTVDLITVAGRESFRIVGLSELDGGSSLGDTAFAFFHDSDAATRLAEPGAVDWILVGADDTTTEAELATAISAATPDAQVLSGSEFVDELQNEVDDSIELIETVLLAFGAIALFVGSFTIANTFTITIAQRTRELALVRAIGASRRQVLGSVFLEAGILGAVAAALGLVAGLGVATALTKVFSATGLEFPSRALIVAPSTVAVSMAAGIVVTVAAAVVPARRAASVAPVDAMRDASIERLDTSRRRVAIGSALGVAGIAALVSGASGGAASTVGLGSLATLLAVLALGPVLVRPVTGALAVPMRRLGASGRLAAANATRNPRRSAATAAALTIGVMLVVGASMFASTAKATLSGDVDDVLTADQVLRPVGMNPGFPTGIAGSIDALDDVRAVPMQITMALLDGEAADVAGLDLPAATGMIRLNLVDGDLGPAGLAIGDRVAEDRGWSVGDTVEMTFADGVSQLAVVGAIFEETTALPPVIAPYDTVAPHGDDLDRLVFVDAPSDALATVESILSTAPTVTVDTVDGYAASLAGSLDMVLTVVLGFLGLAVVIAVLGIATTVGLSVHERTRELGVLRAVGMSRRQLRRSIRLESIAIALFGTLLGMAMGIGFTWALLTTLVDDGLASPVVPAGALVAVTVGALLAGTIAAALPARRAARIAVLDAVRSA